MTAGGTFLLGLGVQKAGTTWLHDYLASSPEADFGFAKEYHVWDLRSPSLKSSRQAFLARLTDRITRRGLQRDYARSAMRYAFMSDPNVYFDYFASLLHRPGIRLTGDITPSYSLLPEEELAEIRDGLQSRGLRVKAVLLLRDPVRRLRSMVRMQHRSKGTDLTSEQEFNLLKDVQARGGDDLRSDYAGILRRARGVFGDDLFLGLYEDLFRIETTAAICNFCGIAQLPADLGKKVNASSLPDHFDEAEYRALATPYLGQIPDLAQVFGTERLARLWPTLAREAGLPMPLRE